MLANSELLVYSFDSVANGITDMMLYSSWLLLAIFLTGIIALSIILSIKHNKMNHTLEIVLTIILVVFSVIAIRILIAIFEIAMAKEIYKNASMLAGSLETQTGGY